MSLELSRLFLLSLSPSFLDLLVVKYTFGCVFYRSISGRLSSNLVNVAGRLSEGEIVNSLRRAADFLQSAAQIFIPGGDLNGTFARGKIVITEGAQELGMVINMFLIQGGKGCHNSPNHINSL